MKDLITVLMLSTLLFNCSESKVEQIKSSVELDSTFNTQLKHYYKSMESGDISEIKKFLYPDYFICLVKDFPSLKEVPDSVLTSISNEFISFSKKNNLKVRFYCGEIKRKLQFENITVYEFDSILEAKKGNKTFSDSSNSFAFSKNMGLNWTFLPGDNDDVKCIIEHSLPNQLKRELLKEKQTYLK